MDRELMQAQQLLPPHLSRGFFGRMVAISLTLHVLFSFWLLTPSRTSFRVPTVNYLELKNFSIPEAGPVEARHSEAEDMVPETTAETPLPAEKATESSILQQEVKELKANAQSRPEQLQERSFGLGLTNGYFSSIAEGETLRNDIKDYYFSMLREINEKWWLTNDGSGARARGAVVEIVVAKNGTIVNKTLIKSSGNRAFDRRIFTALEKANPLPPLPNAYHMNYFSAPIRFVAPSGLFAS